MDEELLEFLTTVPGARITAQPTPEGFGVSLRLDRCGMHVTRVLPTVTIREAKTDIVGETVRTMIRDLDHFATANRDQP